jgi:hypothetical protein
MSQQDCTFDFHLNRFVCLFYVDEHLREEEEFRKFLNFSSQQHIFQHRSGILLLKNK